MSFFSLKPLEGSSGIYCDVLGGSSKVARLDSQTNPEAILSIDRSHRQVGRF